MAIQVGSGLGTAWHLVAQVKELSGVGFMGLTLRLIG